MGPYLSIQTFQMSKHAQVPPDIFYIYSSRLYVYMLRYCASRLDSIVTSCSHEIHHSVDIVIIKDTDSHF